MVLPWPDVQLLSCSGLRQCEEQKLRLWPSAATRHRATCHVGFREVKSLTRFTWCGVGLEQCSFSCAITQCMSHLSSQLNKYAVLQGPDGGADALGRQRGGAGR